MRKIPFAGIELTSQRVRGLRGTSELRGRPDMGSIFSLNKAMLNIMCVCVCVCVFIKLHITTQSGPVILVILCHSH